MPYRLHGPKHAGLTFVLLPFTTPEVTYRAIKQMTGAADFCEDFRDGVRAPMSNVIGGLCNGWRVAMTALGHERGGEVTAEFLPFEAGWINGQVIVASGYEVTLYTTLEPRVRLIGTAPWSFDTLAPQIEQSIGPALGGED